MPEIQTKDKLITLEELGVALNGKAGVTGVKGNAEASYRQGNVNLTPANIGAVAKTGDTITGPLTMNSNLFGALGSTGFRITDESGALSYLCTADDFYGSGGGWNHFIICNHGDGATYYNYVLRLPFEDNPKYKRQMSSTSNQTPWYDFLTSEKTVSVLQGGTGATDAAGARNNIGLHAIHRVVITDSDGKFIISFQNAGVTSTPSVCLLQDNGIYDGIMIRYCRSESSSSLVFAATWSSNGGKLVNAYLDVQGIVIE